VAHITGTFELASWDEEAYDEPGDGSKLTMATWTASVVDGWGTGGLKGIAGSGTFGAVHGPEASFDLDLRVG
jgi:hypothetical protein